MVIGRFFVVGGGVLFFVLVFFVFVLFSPLDSTVEEQHSCEVNKINYLSSSRAPKDLPVENHFSITH